MNSQITIENLRIPKWKGQEQRDRFQNVSAEKKKEINVVLDSEQNFAPGHLQSWNNLTSFVNLWILNRENQVGENCGKGSNLCNECQDIKEKMIIEKEKRKEEVVCFRKTNFVLYPNDM